eukprot:737048-Pleurochrysis_carterae.AAC.1
MHNCIACDMGYLYLPIHYPWDYASSASELCSYPYGRVTKARSHDRRSAGSIYMLRPRGSNAPGAPRAHEELLVQILHEELVGSAVHCRRA